MVRCKMATKKWNCGKAVISLRVATQCCLTDDSVRATKREPEPSIQSTTEHFDLSVSAHRCCLFRGLKLLVLWSPYLTFPRPLLFWLSLLLVVPILLSWTRRICGQSGELSTAQKDFANLRVGTTRSHEVFIAVLKAPPLHAR